MVQLSTTDPKKTITTKLSSVELFWFIRFDIKISATDCGYKVTIFNLEKKKKKFCNHPAIVCGYNVTFYLEVTLIS